MINVPTLADLDSDTWTYTEMGSRNKKTGRLKYYTVTVKNFIIINCSCPAREFRRHTPCKHMKRLHIHTPHLAI